MEVPNIKFHKNSSSGNRADTYGQTEGWTDMTNVTGAFRGYASSPEKRGVANSAQITQMTFI